MTDWLARFSEHLRVERRLSQHTVENYARDLKSLAEFLEKEKIAEWGKLDSQHIRLFAARPHAAGLAPRSIQRRLSAVRTFFEFLNRETQAANAKATAVSPDVRLNPAVEVRAPKGAKRLPNTLDADRMASLLDFQPDTVLDARDK